MNRWAIAGSRDYFRVMETEIDPRTAAMIATQGGGADEADLFAPVLSRPDLTELPAGGSVVAPAELRVEVVRRLEATLRLHGGAA